ncbi:MAG: glutamate synthase-related protein [Deltaproteobacteria bacterium]|nr:glutamate synthase-related protein [Deltaproteobacteria bacterium]
MAESKSATKWRCTICGYVAEGEYPPDKCPICSASSDKFEAVGSPPVKEEKKTEEPSVFEAHAELVDYLSPWSRSEYEKEEKFTTIQKLAITGKSEISPMGTRRPFPGLEMILFKGVQFSRFPLNENEAVSTKTVIGPSAKYPLELDIPFYVSHMSFGALSKEAKIALAMGASKVGTATCSGEGGMLPEEREHSSRYIYEIGTAAFSRNEEYIKQADAVEIKFGQAAKPGMGGHLPGEKVTPEIAKVRNIEAGEDFISPNRQDDINSPEDLKKMIADLRSLTKGRPIGVKFAAGHVEEDLKFVLAAEPDFITIDCRGGATGAAPNFIRDNVCLPAVYAIRKARSYLDSVGSKVTFCVTGGFRDSTDIAKALALGADAVALASASLVAIGCQQYRICNTGLCPVGITTQDKELRSRFSIPHSVKRFVNFYDATRMELEVLSRINGRSNVHDLAMDDIFTISNEIAANTDIEYA